MHHTFLAYFSPLPPHLVTLGRTLLPPQSPLECYVLFKWLKKILAPLLISYNFDIKIKQNNRLFKRNWCENVPKLKRNFPNFLERNLFFLPFPQLLLASLKNGSHEKIKKVMIQCSTLIILYSWGN
jgi:hypothetical protein